MKRALKISCAVIAVLLAVAACESNSNKKSEPIEKQSLAAFDQLKFDIGVYTAAFIDVNGSLPVTRAPKWWRVVKNDALGALVGFVLGGGGGLGVVVGVLNGVGCSIGFAKSELIVPGIEATVMVLPDEYIELVGGDEWDEFGYIHNEIIMDLYGKYGEDVIAAASQEQLFNLIIIEVELRGYDISFINEDKGEIMASLLQASDFVIKEDLAGLKTAYPEIISEIEILEMYVDAYDVIAEDSIVDFTVGFRDAVEESSIPAESKILIRTGISTALGSGSLWTAN